MEVQVLNTEGARPGDRVMIGFETSPLLKASFLLYIFPVVCMLSGALAGQEFSARMGMAPSTGSVVGAFLFFFLSFVFVRFRSNRMARNPDYRPRIVRVLGANGASPFREQGCGCGPDPGK